MAKTQKIELEVLPVEKQPYVIPANWCWLTLESINTYKGASVDPSKAADEVFELYSVPSSEGNYPEIVAGSEIGSAKQSVEKGDVLLCKINPRINRVWWIEQHTENSLIASSEWIVVRNKKIDPKYLMFCFRAQYFRELMLSNVSGVGGSLMRAQPKFVKQYPVPIAPLAEQQRIVDRIESLFAKLDEAKEKAQEALESFEIRQSSMLQMAFSGKLTKQWRQEKQKENSWKTVRFDEAAYIRSNLVEPAEFADFPHIAPDNIEKKTGRLLEYRTISEDGVKSGKHHFYAGQILYSKIRPYLSKVVVVDFEGLCSADMYPIEAVGNSRFLWYQMLSDDFLLQASSAGSRSVLPKINQKELSAIKVRTTDDMDEQKEIVRILDFFYEEQAQAKEKIEETIETIDLMKKSILAKAFRGELGTNDPADESALELLKAVL